MKRAASAPCIAAGLLPGKRAASARWRRVVVLAGAGLLASCVSALAADAAAPQPLHLLGIPVDFILFGATLLGVAVLHHHTLRVALAGLAAIVAYKFAFTSFQVGKAAAVALVMSFFGLIASVVYVRMSRASLER